MPNKTKIQDKSILITGGCGFIGSHLAKSLATSNSICILDNKSSGKRSHKNKNIKYFIGETININKIFKNNFKFDYIFHLGEYSRVEQSFDEISKVIDYNTKPFFEVLEFAKRNNSKFIYSGSSTKFANYINNKDTSPYAWSKISNIKFLKHFSHWFGLDYAVTYFYNAYGKGESHSGKYATVIAKFLKLKKSGKNFLPIVKPGNQKRNFTHVNDIVNGLEIVALYGKGDGYGIGSEKSYSIVDLAKLLKMNYKLIPNRKGNRLSGDLKTNKIKKLGWEEKYNLKDYIKDELNY